VTALIRCASSGTQTTPQTSSSTTVELAACEDALVLGLYEAHGARVARGPFAIITLLARR
jgi:hypothetical protein